MKKMKKVLASLLAATMIMSMSFSAFADETTPKADTNPTFTKTYKEVNEDSVSPKETFTFSFTADKVTDTNKNLDKSAMPTIADVRTDFAAGAATVEGAVNEITVALNNITWPGVGVYYYTVTETENNTAGVEYNTENVTATMKITVAYDAGTDTYYTAFVTLSDEMDVDDDDDGVTDGTKIGGFDNKYSAGELTVQKLVDGNLADPTAKFIIVVTFDAPEDKVVRENITFDGNGTVYSVEGTGDARTLTKIENGNVAVAASEANGWDTTQTVAIEVNHEQYVTFKNIPYGVTYTVVEDDYTGEAKGKYNAAVYDYDEDTDAIVEEDNLIIDDAADKVVITNVKGVVVDTGISLDSMPYIMVLAMAFLGMFGFVSKKRNMEF